MVDVRLEKPSGSLNPAYIAGWSDRVEMGTRRPLTEATVKELEDYEAGWTDADEQLDRVTKPDYDAVKIPAHYNSGQIEVANFIADQGLDYVRGNVVKYTARAGKKDPAKELEDLEKAAAYLQMAYNLAQGKPAVVRDPETKEVVWTLFRN